MANTGPTPAAEDIPIDRAWRQGRRLYVRCGYRSALNAELRAIGARWDDDQRALWVGPTRFERALPLIRAYVRKLERIEATKALGLWVAVPRGAAEVRARAKDLECVYDDGRKEWAAPSPAAQARLEELVAEHKDRKKTERAAAKRRREELAAAAGRGEGSLEELTARDLAARAGRVSTGEFASHRWVSTRPMRGPDARKALHPVGAVIELADGRHGVVVEAKAWFTGDEEASSLCWHDEITPGAHWDLWHRVVVVEDTAEEEAERQERAARAADAAELRALMQALGRGAIEGSPPADLGRRVGAVSCRYGTGHTRHGGGTVELYEDGRVVWTHPGYHDDYRATWVSTRDEDAAVRVWSALAGGPRRRVVVDQMEYEYTVTVD